tara:strand:- start:71 stop:2140 length:2070 start_codon:yes stop_codon:yes gene_type:complete
MKFKELKERLSKMSGSKLTGQELSVYYRENPLAKKAARDPMLKKAIEFALDHGGAMNYAIKNIEKMKRGISRHPQVQQALQFANESNNVQALKDAINEKMSPAEKKKRLDMIRKAVEKLNARADAQAKKDALAAIKSMESVEEGMQIGGDFVRGQGVPKKSVLLDDIKEFMKYNRGKKSNGEKFGGINDITIRFSGIPTGEVEEPKHPMDKRLYPNGRPVLDYKLAEKHAKQMMGTLTNLMKRPPYNVFPKPTMINDPIQIYAGHQYKGDYKNDPKLKVDISEILMDIAKISFKKEPGANARIKDMGGFFGGMNESVNEGMDTREKNLNYKIKELEYKMKLKDFMKDMVDAKLPKKKEKKEEAVESLKVNDTSSDAFNKLSKIARDIGVELSREENHLLVKGDAKKMEEFKAQMSVAMKESKEIKEGTWQVPDSYPKLLGLQKFLKKPHKAKTAKEVFAFHNEVDKFFGDDSFSDDLDSYYDMMPGGDVDPYDGKKQSPEEYRKTLKRLEDYYKRNPQSRIKKGSDLNYVLMKHLTDWTGGVLKFKGNEIVQMPRDWYMKDNPEFKKSDAPIKAKLNADVDVDDVAVKEVQFKRKRGNLKMKRQPSIQVESTTKTFSDLREMSMKDIMRKHGRELKKAVRLGNLELPMDVENDLYQWAMDNGEVRTDDPDEFIEWLDNNLDDIVKGRIR